MSLHDRTFDLVLLSNWEDQIVYEPENIPEEPLTSANDLTAPVNKQLDSGAWTQGIMWSPRAPYRSFPMEFDQDDEGVPEQRPTGKTFSQYSFIEWILNHVAEAVRPRKRMRMDAGPSRDKFNLSNDQFYDMSKDGGRHRVRQTFGQLTVEHAYPAQKLQLPFVRPFQLSLSLL
jgi:transcription initiation factor TFIID subunit 1, fungi type